MQVAASSRRFRVLALVTSLSVVWAACSILFPYGFPWIGIGWAGLALTAALWVSSRSARSMSQVLHAVEAEPTTAKAGHRPPTWVQVAWLSLCPALLLSGTPDTVANTCDRGRLTESEAIAVTVAVYDRNVSDCKGGFSPCDRSTLNGQEAAEVDAVVRARNMSYCSAGTVTARG
jgi:hypothetical protein